MLPQPYNTLPLGIFLLSDIFSTSLLYMIYNSLSQTPFVTDKMN